MGYANLTGTVPDLQISETHREQGLPQLLRPPGSEVSPPLELRRFKLLTLSRIHGSAG